MVFPVQFDWRCCRADPEEGTFELTAFNSDAGDCRRTFAVTDAGDGRQSVRIVSSYTAASPIYQLLLRSDALFFRVLLPAALSGRVGLVTFAKSAVAWTLLVVAFQGGATVGSLVGWVVGAWRWLVLE